MPHANARVDDARQPRTRRAFSGLVRVQRRSIPVHRVVAGVGSFWGACVALTYIGPEGADVEG